MSDTSDTRSVGDLPNELGKTAPRELHNAGISSLADVAKHTRKGLLAIHGVGPKAIRILEPALAAKGLVFREDEAG